MTRHPRAKGTPNPAFAPISAAEYFTSASVVDVGPLSIRVYYTPPATAGNGAGSVLVCHHGAGYAGLSFAAFAREVRDVTRGELGVLAFDARRHGKIFCSVSLR
jgi:protein phosphatase methylesterase 1